MKTHVTVLAVALVALSGGTIHLWRQLDAERQLNTDLQARVKVLETSQQSLAAAFARRAPAAASMAEPPTAAGPAAPAAAQPPRPAAAQRPMETIVSRARETLATPEGRQAVSGMVRAMLPLALPDVAKVLNLSPAEADKLFELLAKQQEGQLGRFAGGTSVQEMMGKAEEIRQANEAQIAAQLGSKYPQWQEYQDTLPLRQQVNELQTALGASGNRLSDSQTGPLIAALSAEQKRITEESRNVPAVPGATPQERRQQQQQRTADNNRRLVDTASAYMNAQQLETYKSTLERQGRMQGMLGGLLGGQGMGGRGGQVPPQ